MAWHPDERLAALAVATKAISMRPPRQLAFGANALIFIGSINQSPSCSAAALAACLRLARRPNS